MTQNEAKARAAFDEFLKAQNKFFLYESIKDPKGSIPYFNKSKNARGNAKYRHNWTGTEWRHKKFPDKPIKTASELFDLFKSTYRDHGRGHGRVVEAQTQWNSCAGYYGLNFSLLCTWREIYVQCTNTVKGPEKSESIATTDLGSTRIAEAGTTRPWNVIDILQDSKEDAANVAQNSESYGAQTEPKQTVFHSNPHYTHLMGDIQLDLDRASNGHTNREKPSTAIGLETPKESLYDRVKMSTLEKARSRELSEVPPSTASKSSMHRDTRPKRVIASDSDGQKMSNRQYKVCKYRYLSKSQVRLKPISCLGGSTTRPKSDIKADEKEQLGFSKQTGEISHAELKDLQIMAEYTSRRLTQYFESLNN